jgi:hypothetical protein
MVKKSIIYFVALAALFLNLIIPACGSKNNGANYGANTVCFNGQVCTNGTYGGVPLFGNQPITTSVDTFGSAAQFAIYASNYVSGQSNFTGSVSLTGELSLAPNGYNCPPGNYTFSGNSLNFQANFGGSLGLISGTVQISNGPTIYLNGQIFQGQDPMQSVQTYYFYRGNFGISGCDPNNIAE